MAEVTADAFFDSSHFKLTKTAGKWNGHWPFQTKLQKITLRFTVFFIMGSGIPPLINALIVHSEKRIDMFIQIFPPLATIMTCLLKYGNLVINNGKIKQLLMKIYRDWNTITGSENLKILEEYTIKGKIITQFYTYYILISAVLFLSFPFLPTILDVIIPLNESRPKRTTYPAEYGFDKFEYYWPVMFHMTLCSLIIIFVIIAADVLFVTLVFHTCGLFAIAGYQLNHYADELDNATLVNFEGETYTANVTKVYCNRLITSAQYHQDSLHVAAELASCFTSSLFLIVSLNMLLMSTTGFQVIMKEGQWEEMLTAVIYTLAQLLHLLFLSLPGQVLIDVSGSVRDLAYNAAWYNIPPAAQTLLTMVLMRSFQPCHIAAGGLLVLNMDTFSTILQTSMSYFTMLVNCR